AGSRAPGAVLRGPPGGPETPRAGPRSADRPVAWVALPSAHRDRLPRHVADALHDRVVVGGDERHDAALHVHHLAVQLAAGDRAAQLLAVVAELGVAGAGVGGGHVLAALGDHGLELL